MSNKSDNWITISILVITIGIALIVVFPAILYDILNAIVKS